MRLLPICFLLALSSPALAEDINDTGWKIACLKVGCHISSGGFALWTTADSDPAALKVLQDMPDLSAVNFLGTLQNMGDSSADLTLAYAQRSDNIHEGNLQFLQGDWRPVGEGAPYFIRFAGLEWQEWNTGEMVDAFALVAGEACADGTVYQGTVLSLYRLGDDPDADGCWAIEYIDEQTLTLRDLSGDWGAVEYTR